MVLVIDKRTVHVQVPDSPVISFSSSKNFSLQIWYSCEAVFTCVRVLTVSEVLTMTPGASGECCRTHTAGDGQGQPRDLERRPRLAARARLARTAGKDTLVDRRLRHIRGQRQVTA